MFVIPGIIALLVFTYIRPQELYDVARPISMPMVVMFAAFGYVLDLRLGNAGPRRASLLLWLAAAFWGWMVLTIAVAAPDTLVDNLRSLAPTMALFFALALGISTLRGLRAITLVLVSLTMLIAAVAIEQGLQPTTCVADDASPVGRFEHDSVIGRPCENRASCYESNPTPGREYLCEHVGRMNTMSVTGRVRFRGIFEDPNELAWSLSIALPFVFAWFERRRVTHGGMQVGPAILTLAVLAACGFCNIMTKSRSGQISLIATLGVYFLNRFRWRGLALGVAMAVPILMLGGRSDDSSTQERLECWSQALTLWREHPFMGVGGRQFVQHHYLTAHNSVMLAIAETGPVGVVLFFAIVYAAFKMTLRAQRQLAGRPEAAEARAVAFATVAALTGTVASCFFLSITYHVAFWVVLGLAGAVHAMVSRHDPDWDLPWSLRDTGLVLGLAVAVVSGTALYLRSKGL